MRLEHVGICAKDTTALKDWYIKVFGFKIVYDNKKSVPTYFLLMEDKSMIEIYPMEEEDPSKTNKHQGIRHLAFGTDTIEADYQNLIDHEVEIITPLAEVGPGVKTAFFKDPEGNIIHFIQRERSLLENLK